jgi:hypothetical protein
MHKIERPTSNVERRMNPIQRWAFNVGCSMFSNQCLGQGFQLRSDLLLVAR